MSLGAETAASLATGLMYSTPLLVGGVWWFNRARKEYIPSIDEQLNLGEIVTVDGYTRRRPRHYHQTPDGALTRFFVVQGFDYSATSFDNRVKKAKTRQSFLEAAAKSGVKLKVVIKKRAANIPAVRRAAGGPTVQRLEQKWSKGFEALSIKTTYLLLEVEKTSQQRALDEVAENLLVMLDDYNPRELQHDEEHSEIMEFFGDLINPGLAIPTKGHRADLAARLAATDFMFNQKSGVIRFNRDTQRTYGAIVVLNETDGDSESTMIDDVLALPYEITVLHSCKGFDREKSKDKARQAERLDFERLRSPEIARQHKEYQTKLDSGVKGARLSAELQLHFLVHAKDKEELAEAVQQVRTVLSKEYGAVATTLSDATPQAYFNFFPGRWSRYRAELLDTQQFATLQPFEGSHSGFDRCAWGDTPVQRYPGYGGNGVVNVTFHEDETSLAANTALIGATGGGKTTLAMHLMYGVLAAYPKARVLFITRRQGGYAAVKAAGGKFFSLGGEDDSNTLEFNPFRRDLTPAGLLYIVNFLRLIGGEGGEISSAAEKAIEGVTRTLKRMEAEDKLHLARLDTIFEGHLTGLGRFSDNVARWVTNERYNRIFNGKTDAFAEEMHGDTRVFSVDSLGLIDDEVASTPVFFHLLKTFEAECVKKGYSFVVLGDEIPAILGHPFIRKKINELSVEIRKNKGLLFLLFQNIGQIEDHGLVPMLNTEFRTRLFLRSDEKPERLEQFGLSPQAIDILTSPKTPKHTVLMHKRELTSAFNADLRGLGHELEILKSEAEVTQAAERLEKQYGPDFPEHLIRLAGNYD